MDTESVISIFEQHKETVLTFPVHIKGKEQKLYVLRELMVENNGPADPDQLSKRLQELPAVLAFYGTMLDNAERLSEEAKEEFDVWYAGMADEVTNKYNENMQKSTLPASLKKPLTIDALKGKVMVAYPEEWKQKKEILNAAKERTSLLRRMVESLTAAIRLIQSETNLMGIMMSSGIAESKSNKQSGLNSFLRK